MSDINFRVSAKSKFSTNHWSQKECTLIVPQQTPHNVPLGGAETEQRCVTSEGASTWGPLLSPTFLGFGLHDQGHVETSERKRKKDVCYCKPTVTFRKFRSTSTHLHGLHCIGLKVMYRLLMVLLWGITKSSEVDHIAVIESHIHSKKPRGGTKVVLQETEDRRFECLKDIFVKNIFYYIQCLHPTKP